MSDHLDDLNDFEVHKSSDDSLTNIDLYKKFLDFTNTFEHLPKAELLKRGWLRDANDMSSMLPLFRDIQSGRNNRLYRKANTANEALCLAWLSKITSKAKLSFLVNRVPEYKGLDKATLRDIAKLSRDVGILKELPKILADYGVVLVYERALPRMKLDGVVFKLDSGNPVIGLSLRFHRLDNFWFTVMHELAHVVLHFAELETPIFDDIDNLDEELIELQADRLAKESFVSRDVWRSCEPKYQKNTESVVRFAKEIGIHPAIVAGMLRKESNSYDMYSDMVNKVNVREMILGHD